MIKNQSVIEIRRGERVYQLQLDSNSPLGEIHDVIHEMKNYIINLIMERHKQEVIDDEPEEKQKTE